MPEKAEHRLWQANIRQRPRLIDFLGYCVHDAQIMATKEATNIPQEESGARSSNAELVEQFKQKILPASQQKILNVNMRDPTKHPGQMLLCRTDYKNKIVRAGRRGGKTVGAAILAVEAFFKGTRVLYAAPRLDQVTTFWTEVCGMLHQLFQYDQLYKNETKKIIQGTPIQENETPDEAEKNKQMPRIRAKTAWDPDGLRGDYAGLLILDEFQDMAEETLSEVGLPMLMDVNGDLVLIYTPPSLETRSKSNARDPRHAAKKFKEVQNDPEWLCIHFPSGMNPHISAEGVSRISRGMTQMAYRQEILALDTDEVPGALWSRQLLDDTHVSQVPCDLKRIVVGIDPSGSTTTEVGIVAAGMGTDGHIYVLQDASMKAPRPKAWAQKAISVYEQLDADRILGERNYGGDMVEETIRNVDPNVSYRDVNATKGKIVRAEPVCAMFEQGKMHIVVTGNEDHRMENLEDELCSYVPGEKSPNRMDAMVWCGIELLKHGGLGLVDFFKSGKAEALVGRKPVSMTTTVEKVKNASSLSAVVKNDQTPQCEKCECQVLQPIGNQVRCSQCGHQQWPHGTPAAAKPLGGRRIELLK